MNEKAQIPNRAANDQVITSPGGRSMNSVKRIAVILAVAALSAGCNVHVERIAELGENLKSQEARADRLATDLSTLAERMFAFAEQNPSINAYEMVLEAQERLDEANRDKEMLEQAYRVVWELTREADLLEGYVYFLQQYPLAPENLITSANDRICELAFDVARKENTIEGYRDFLNSFPTAPKSTRQDAIERAAVLERIEFSEELVGLESSELERAQEAVARRLYVNGRLEQEQTEDQDGQRDAGVLIAHHTITRSEALMYTRTSVIVLANEDVKKRLERIENKLDELRSDVGNLRKEVLKKMQQLDASQGIIIQQLAVLKKRQDDLIRHERFPFESWDPQKSIWDNFKQVGKDALPYIAKVALT